MSGHENGRRPDRISIQNVNHPGRTTIVDAEMYRAVSEAMLVVLPAAAPGLTHEEMVDALMPRLPEDLFPGGEKAGWWSKAVQLDLEAKRAIVREPSTPLRWHRVAE